MHRRRGLPDLPGGLRRLLAEDRGTAAGHAAASVLRQDRQLWTHCRFQQRKVMTAWEFVALRPVTTLVLVIHDELVRGGMKHRAARLLAGFWLPREDLAVLQDQKIALPTGRSATPLLDAVDLALSRTALLVRNRPVANIRKGRVEASAKRDGPDGFFIDPLFRSLRDERKKLQAAARQGGRPFRGQVLVIADRRTSYRLLAEALYTSAQAGFRRFQPLVRHPDEKNRVVLFETPRLATAGRPGPTPAATVSVSATALTLQHGKGAKLRFPVTGGKLTEAVKRLAQAAWKARSVAKASAATRAWGTVLIQPSPSLTLADLVPILDALRVAPRDASPQPAPAGRRRRARPGCGFVVDRRQHRWTNPPYVIPQCLYPYAVLGLGSD